LVQLKEIKHIQIVPLVLQLIHFSQRLDLCSTQSLKYADGDMSI